MRLFYTSPVVRRSSETFPQQKLKTMRQRPSGPISSILPHIPVGGTRKTHKTGSNSGGQCNRLASLSRKRFQVKRHQLVPFSNVANPNKGYLIDSTDHYRLWSDFPPMMSL